MQDGTILAASHAAITWEDRRPFLEPPYLYLLDETVERDSSFSFDSTGPGDMASMVLQRRGGLQLTPVLGPVPNFAIRRRGL